MSTSFAGAPLRLRTISWPALAEHLPALLGTLERVLAGAEAAQALSKLLRERGALADANARQALAEATFGVALWRRLLAHFAGMSEAAPSAAQTLLFVFLRDLAGLPAETAGRLSGLAEALQPERRAGPDSLAVRGSIPDWMLALLEAELGTEVEAFLEAINVPGPIFLRAQVSRISREELASRLALEDGIHTRPTVLSPWGLEVLSPRPNIYGSKSYQEGLYEVQDEGSQLLGQLLGARPEDDVLDYCAGAGGKTLLLSSLLRGRARLYAYDLDASRLERLERRVQKARGHPVRVQWREPGSELQVDRVLVDAPCSELGALRRGPDVRWRLDPTTFERFPALQSGILDQAARHVRVGGYLLYATCTLRTAENEGVVEAFLHAHAGAFRRVRPALALPQSAYRGSDVRLLPHRHGTDGFYAALLERTAN